MKTEKSILSISSQKPPNWENIIKIFPNLGSDPKFLPIFCYGNVVYNVRGDKLREDLIVHEKVHALQQKDGIEGWWYKFLNDLDFRLDQELDAYGAQYAFLKGIIPNKKHSKVLYDLAHDLVNWYGLSITQSQAESKIRNRAKLVV